MDPATVISVVAFAFQSFQGCIQAFDYFHTARNIGRDGDLLRTFLEFERFRLTSWAEKVGVDSESSRFDSSRISLNWNMARGLLEQLQILMSDADRLKERYSLDVTGWFPTAIEFSSQNWDNEDGNGDPKFTNDWSIAKFIKRLKPSTYTMTSKAIRLSNGPVKKARWAVRDKTKLQRFITDIRTIIGNLYLLLDAAEREVARREYDHLLRGVISLSATTSDLGQVIDVFNGGFSPSTNKRAITAAASCKQVRLILGTDKREDEVRPAPSSVAETRAAVPHLKKLKRGVKPWPRHADLGWAGLEFAEYNGRQVLIQWKTSKDDEWERFEVPSKATTVLLMSITDESFRSLLCMGYLPMKEHDAHGIVYETPDSSTDWAFKSLKELMTTCPLVSLARRLEIGRALAETILQLHTAGWMHKNLRSENIIFLAARGADDQIFLKSEPYVVGYDYARQDTPVAAQDHTQLPVSDLEGELYRHPQARGVNRETYQKRFDLYALAAILTELVAWKPLVDIHSAYTSAGLGDKLNGTTSEKDPDLPSLNDLIGSAEAVTLLEYHGGMRIVEIIKDCCSIEFDGEDALLGHQAAVVDGLSWCRV
ncbi:prion-inhibition and propagation-domain-containing protein [Cercophora newfieldiana]|uniref:Prion-inhibition and propagation-domain-containing protein n=1 Tax=Cercophora newfieldiana TaxID=92897 RepID=A0AA39XSJ2_9PEZI|nr:prion-inhibition and propagation-domain-containing protein [Cercophora newfieldiana]